MHVHGHMNPRPCLYCLPGLVYMGGCPGSRPMPGRLGAWSASQLCSVWYTVAVLFHKLRAACHSHRRWRTRSTLHMCPRTGRHLCPLSCTSLMRHKEGGGCTRPHILCGSSHPMPSCLSLALVRVQRSCMRSGQLFAHHHACCCINVGSICMRMHMHAHEQKR